MWLIVEQFPIKPGWWDAPFVLWDFSRGNKQSLISHHENLDLSSWKSRPFIMKISTVHHEHLDRSTWKSRPFIMKISTVHHENLDHLIWKSRPFVIKSRLLVITSLPFVMKITQFFVQMAFHNWYQNWSLLYKTHWSKFTKTKFLIKCAVQVRSLMECVKLDIFFGSWNLQTKSMFYFKLLNQITII